MTPHEQEQRITAARTGYGQGAGAVAQLNADHDPCHLEVCSLLGRGYSPTLRWVATGERAHPTRHAEAVGWEEALVLEVQTWLNTGEEGGTLRVLWWWGLDPEQVRQRLLAALGREP